MSFRVETSRNYYTDYQIFSATRFNELGQNFLSLINPNHEKTINEDQSTRKNIIEQPSDLCRPIKEQNLYYLTNQNVVAEIEENFIPHQTIFPFTPSSIDNNEQLTTSIPDWQTSKQSFETSKYPLSQIITIIQCRSTLTSNSFSSPSHRYVRPAIRLFINSHYQQQHQMDTFLDIVNETLLLEPDTIKILWDSNGEPINNPMDLLHRGRLYFASHDENINLDELNVSERDLASINRLEIIRSQMSQPANFVEKPLINEITHTPSRKSTPFNADDRRSANIQSQAIIYNDPQTFPEVFLRHYTVGEIIGDGRFSAVFECQDKATGIQLALKIIDKTRCKGYEFLIENELSILQRVKHPNIIKLVEEYQNEYKYFLVLEFVSNGDLLTAVTKLNKYSEHDVALMLSQIASALKHLHSLKIVHRDVKLENILISNYPDQSITLKLADFGLALCLTDPTPNVTEYGNSLCGTPMYLAPEIIQNRDYRIENDMWSLGVVTFTLLSGRTPFNGENDDEILSNVINKTIDFNLLPKISADCRDALSLMLERDPNRRISANELLQHQWIKRETQRRMEPVNEGRTTTRRRKKGTTQQQPLLTFSSVEHFRPNQSSAGAGLMSDVDEL